MSDGLQIGIIGSGNIAKSHLGGLAKMEGVKLAAFCDVVEERAQAMAQEHGGKSYTDPKAMFSDHVETTVEEYKEIEAGHGHH